MVEAHSSGVAGQTLVRKVAGTHTNEGFRLSEAFDVAASNTILVTLSVVLSIGTVLWFAMLWRDAGAPLLFLGPLLLAVTSFKLSSITINKLRIARTFGPAEVVLEQWPLRLGERVQVRFRRALRGNVRVKGVQAALLCREWVRQRSIVRTRQKVRTDLSLNRMKRSRTGIKQSELSKDVWEAELPVPAVVPVTNGVLELSLPISIPEHLSASFHTTDNTVRWLLWVEIEAENFPPLHAEFEIVVLHEVV